MKRSGKQKLIVALEARLNEPTLAEWERERCAYYLRLPKGRGSGPLPFWAKLLARDLGVN